MSGRASAGAAGLAPGRRSSLVLGLGNFLFRYRRAVFPAVFLLVALTAGAPRAPRGNPRADRVLDALGIALALTGQALRAAVIGLAYIKRGGRGRRIYAGTLVQEGLFAHSRNPLYLGNLLVFAGLFVVWNSLAGYLVGLPFFVLAYWAMTLAEEEYLGQRFGAEYAAYLERVPRFWPRFAGLWATLRGQAFDWRRLVRKEYGATFAWTTTLLVLLVWEEPDRARPAFWAWLPLFAGYAVARRLKKTGRLGSD